MAGILYSSIDQKNRVSDLIHTDARPRKNLKAVNKIIFRYLTNFFGYDSYQASEFNLTKVRDTLNGESIFRRVVDKYQEQIWNNGWKFIGRNKENVDYITRRFSEIAYVTDIPTADLFERITRQLVTYSNAFIAKARGNKSSTGSERRSITGKKLQPVAGYWPQSAEYMEIKRDEKGRITKYRLANHPELEWDPEDMIHISIYKQEGYSFGTPMIAPVISDIAALRQVENGTNLMVFQNTIPIYHFVVGTETEPGQEDEILDMNAKIEEMATYGHLVTSERVEINVVGAGKQIIDVVPILEYWKTRVYAGLGVSGIGLGETDTGNRGTATTVVTEFHNTATHFQKKIAAAIDEFMVRELLAEKGLHQLRQNEKNMVHLHLPEIDLETKIKNETHQTFLYEHNAISEDELRISIGKDPVQTSQRGEMFLNLVQIPLAKAKAMAKAEAGTKETNNKNQPENQHGRKQSPSLPKND